MLQDPSWTRLPGTPLYEDLRHVFTTGRVGPYYNWDLLCRMYHHAQITLDYSYDRALDLAIAARAAIASPCRDRNKRAVDWICARLPAIDEDLQDAIGLVEACGAYDLNGNHRLLLLSWCEFTDMNQAITFMDALRLEACRLHGFDDATFYASLEGNFSRIRSAIINADRTSLSARENTAIDIIRPTVGRLQSHLCSPPSN